MVFKRFWLSSVKTGCFRHCSVCVYVLYDGNSSYPFLDVVLSVTYHAGALSKVLVVQHLWLKDT